MHAYAWHDVPFYSCIKKSLYLKMTHGLECLLLYKAAQSCEIAYYAKHCSWKHGSLRSQDVCHRCPFKRGTNENRRSSLAQAFKSEVELHHVTLLCESQVYQVEIVRHWSTPHNPSLLPLSDISSQLIGRCRDPRGRLWDSTVGGLSSSHVELNEGNRDVHFKGCMAADVFWGFIERDPNCWHGVILCKGLSKFHPWANWL